MRFDKGAAMAELSHSQLVLGLPNKARKRLHSNPYVGDLEKLLGEVDRKRAYRGKLLMLRNGIPKSRVVLREHRHNPLCRAAYQARFGRSPRNLERHLSGLEEEGRDCILLALVEDEAWSDNTLDALGEVLGSGLAGHGSFDLRQHLLSLAYAWRFSGLVKAAIAALERPPTEEEREIMFMLALGESGSSVNMDVMAEMAQSGVSKAAARVLFLHKLDEEK